MQENAEVPFNDVQETSDPALWIEKSVYCGHDFGSVDPYAVASCGQY